MMNNNSGVDSPGGQVRVKKFWGLRIFTGLIIFGMITGAIYFQGVKNTHQKELDKAKANYQALKENVLRVENIKKKRIDFFKDRLLTDLPFQYSFMSADFIRRLSLVAAPGISLSSLKIEPKVQGILFFIEGNVEKGNKIVMDSRFFRFRQAIEAFADVILVTGQKKQEDAPDKGLTFTIEGEIGLL